jgi:hypothetical protein
VAKALALSKTSLAKQQKDMLLIRNKHKTALGAASTAQKALAKTEAIAAQRQRELIALRGKHGKALLMASKARAALAKVDHLQQTTSTLRKQLSSVKTEASSARAKIEGARQSAKRIQAEATKAVGRVKAESNQLKKEMREQRLRAESAAALAKRTEMANEKLRKERVAAEKKLLAERASTDKRLRAERIATEKKLQEMRRLLAESKQAAVVASRSVEARKKVQRPMAKSVATRPRLPRARTVTTTLPRYASRNTAVPASTSTWRRGKVVYQKASGSEMVYIPLGRGGHDVSTSWDRTVVVLSGRGVSTLGRQSPGGQVVNTMTATRLRAGIVRLVIELGQAATPEVRVVRRGAVRYLKLIYYR